MVSGTKVRHSEWESLSSPIVLFCLSYSSGIRHTGGRSPCVPDTNTLLTQKSITFHTTLMHPRAKFLALTNKYIWVNYLVIIRNTHIPMWRHLMTNFFLPFSLFVFRTLEFLQLNVLVYYVNKMNTYWYVLILIYLYVYINYIYIYIYNIRKNKIIIIILQPVDGSIYRLTTTGRWLHLPVVVLLFLFCFFVWTLYIDCTV